ncbi:MAG TPA: phage replisome organizer N-terminal domain-containing protein [Spirochaetota bacterium]|nr:phage replisome organizer N-terminal domain-containing protein [Spirochaetota bacterium]
MSGKEKRYFWFRMEDNWFQKKEIKKLRSIAGGDTYVIIYLKIILLSLKNGGKLYFEGIDETFAAEIALEINENKDNVLVTLEYLLRHSSIIQTEENEYRVNDIAGLIGTETSTAIRVRKHRERLKQGQVCDSVTRALPCNADVTPMKQNDNGETETEIELEKEIELELEKERIGGEAAPVRIRKKPITGQMKVVKSLFDVWIESGLRKHKWATVEMTVDQDHYKKAKYFKVIDVVGEHDIATAIRNYASVILHPEDYWFSHQYDFWDFIARGFKKFLADSEPMLKFRRREEERYNRAKPEGVEETAQQRRERLQREGVI